MVNFSRFAWSIWSGLPGQFQPVFTADAFFIAYALADNSNRIIVTHEISNPNQRNKIKIPEPCNDLGVVFCNTIDMFRRLRETF